MAPPSHQSCNSSHPVNPAMNTDFQGEQPATIMTSQSPDRSEGPVNTGYLSAEGETRAPRVVLAWGAWFAVNSVVGSICRLPPQGPGRRRGRLRRREPTES